MLENFQDLVLRISRTWWLYLFVFAVFAGSLQVLILIGERFPAVAAGAVPFDLQNELLASQVYAQLAGYTEQARDLYYVFTAIDFVFPFFAGLFLAATTAFAVRNSLPRLYEALLARKLLLVPMLATAFDWMENLTAVATISLYPTELGWLPALLVAAKKFKLVFMILSNGVMLVALLIAAGCWLRRLLAT